jgi:hypothetical protein
LPGDRPKREGDIRYIHSKIEEVHKVLERIEFDSFKNLFIKERE